jgi:PAS domain S-box-containing protein
VNDLPELFDLRLKARSMAFLFVAGAGVGCLTLVLPHSSDVNEPPIWGLAALAVALAAIVHRQADRLSEWHLHLMLAIGTLILTFANYWVGTTVFYPVIYTWVVLYAFYFFELPLALAHLGWVGANYFVLLLIQQPASPVVRWVLAIGTPAVAGLLISRLLANLRQGSQRALEQARELRESEARTGRILETAHDAFVILDPHGRVHAWNAAAEDMFGIRAREALGRLLADLVFPAEGRDAHHERRRELLARPGPVSGERIDVQLVRRDGTRFPAEAAVSRIEEGDSVLFAAFLRDLSAERHRDDERAALYREQAARREAEQVAEMVSGMQLLVDAALAHTTLDGMLGELLPRVRAVMGADAAAVLLTDEEEGDLVVRASTGGRPEESARVAFGQGFAGRVASAGRPQLVHDPPPNDLVDPAFREAGVASVVGVPLLADGEVKGVIKVGAAPPRRFSEEDLAMLRLAADRVALALDHARLYEREHRIAETLQRSLLPDHLPQLPGLTAAARYLPAAAEAEVGGDWFDVIPMAAGRVGLVMGDVAGKGLTAASMVGRLRSALRAYALEDHAPAVVVDRLNRLLWTELEESEMATLLYVVFDPVEGSVRWVNAGHLPPLMVVGDGLVHFLEGARGVPLGVMPFPTFEEEGIELAQGGRIVLYTDGLVERPGAVIDAGLSALAEAVRSAPEDVEELCDHLLGELVPAAGAGDDVALLAFCNEPVGEHFDVEMPAAPESLASVRAMLRRWLQQADSSEQEIAEITTACGEACTNAIEHAGAGGSGSFEVEGRLDGAAVDILVRDFGSWRPVREGDQGRGLSLMRALMDDVAVSPSAEGTTVRMRRLLNGASAE